MAQQYISVDGRFVIPDAYPRIAVQTQNSGLSISGVIALVGEAETGPSYNQETDLEDDAQFGPDQIAAIVAKYGSGPVVDAARAAAQPANDPNITGAPSRFIIVKTNQGSKASSPLTKVGGGTYGTLVAQLAGANGNLLYQSVFANGTDGGAAEVRPTTGSFTWIPNVASLNIDLRANGGAALPATIAANRTPTQFVSDVDALAGITASGGASVATAQSSVGNISVGSIVGNQMTLSYTGTFTNTPTVGQTLVIPSGSVIAGAGSANVGAYVITAATSASITAIKLSDAGRGGAVAGTITAPLAVGAIAVSATVANDMVVYGTVTITLDAGNVIDGIGKSLEISELTSGTDLLSRCCFALSSTPVTWVSKSASPTLLTSATEYKVELDVSRINDNVSEEHSAGGDIALKISYSGTTATITITSTTLTTAIVGGTGAALNITLSQFATLADLATYINAQTGYKCSVGTTTLGQLPATALDRVTAQGICSTHGSYNGRIKVDAYKFFEAIRLGSAVVQLGTTAARADAGLPATGGPTYFTGGAKGGSSTANFTAALDALERVTCNFVVTCISRDAAGDIADGATDSSSTYAIDSVNAYVRTHVLAMSKVKKKRNRQGFVSKRGTFQEARDAASNLASARMVMTFQDVKNFDSSGTLVQFQPWMGAAIAAGMQAAGFYRAIVRKFANVSGAVMADGSFSDRDDTNVEDALLSGLLPMKRHQSGGYYWVSDQTTWTKDDNFVYNSIQAMYAADIIALTTALRMADAFAGQSVADITASAALTFLQGIMRDFRRLKLIAPSDDAPEGFKNAKVTISGTAMIVEVEIKLAGAIYFIPISFLVSPVQQTATQG